MYLRESKVVGTIPQVIISTMMAIDGTEHGVN